MKPGVPTTSGGELLGDNQTIAIDDAGIAAYGIDQDIVVRQVGMRKSRGMKAPHGTGDLQAHAQTSEKGAFLIGRHVAIDQFGRRKPLSVLLLSIFDVTPCRIDSTEEEFLVV
jgi:hypothetical protein